MEYLHSQNIIHKDLATRNLLVKLNPERNVVKVADFVSSLPIAAIKFHLSNMVFPFKIKIKGLSTESNYNTSNDVISIRWAAPELFSGSKASFKTDVFAFAITMMEIFNQGKSPYWELKNAEVVEFVKSGNRMTLSETVPKEIQELIQHCWDQDPIKRPQFSEISKLLKQIHESG